MPLIVFLILTFSYFSCFARSGWQLAESNQTVVKLKDSFGTCTGTRISKTGHILTARHCFNSCIVSKKMSEEIQIFPEDGWQSPNLYKMTTYNDLFCEVLIDGVLEEVQLIGGSPGFMTPMEQSTLSYMSKVIYDKFLKLNYFYTGDFLIIKQKDNHEFACSKLAKTSSLIGEYLYYNGYPTQSSGRGLGRESDGEQMYFSEGKRFQSILKNSCLSPSQNKGELVLKYDRDEIILSDIDVIQGASGSALMNKKGEIVGLINSTFSSGIDLRKQYCSGSALAISIFHVLDIVKNQVENLKPIFDCP